MCTRISQQQKKPIKCSTQAPLVLLVFCFMIKFYVRVSPPVRVFGCLNFVENKVWKNIHAHTHTHEIHIHWRTHTDREHLQLQLNRSFAHIVFVNGENGIKQLLLSVHRRHYHRSIDKASRAHIFTVISNSARLSLSLALSHPFALRQSVAQTVLNSRLAFVKISRNKKRNSEGESPWIFWIEIDIDVKGHMCLEKVRYTIQF